MRRCSVLIILTALFLPASRLGAQSPPDQVPSSVLEQAAAEFRQGNLTEAEHVLRAPLKQTPHDPAALGLLGVILDAQKRYDEAERAYRQALVLAPGSPALMNNLGNHYLAQGKTDEARTAFLKVVSAEPRHPNANLQLAQLSVADKQGPSALKYLDHLSPEDQASAPVAILRARGLRLAGRDKAGEDLLAQVEGKAGNDPGVAFSIGMTYVDWRRYAEAEHALTRALDAEPANFDILYNLGLAAQHAGHLAHALEVYQVALQQRPNDADCLFNLASIYTQTGHPDQAIIPLIEARKAAPERPEILFALAQTSQDLGFYGDAATAIDQYLKLKPHDDIARRERGFCLIRSAKLDQGLEDLRWYVQKHAQDPRGLYELAIGETVRESDKSLQHLDRALTIDPKFNAARYARGVLCYRQGRIAESVDDLKIALQAEPKNYAALDALGEDYLRLNRPEEAAKVLEKAAKLAPKEAKILMHYGRALQRLNRREEAEQVLTAFKNLGPEETRRRPYGGLFDFLSLPPEEQFSQYLRNLERTVNTRPEDPGLKVRLGRALLSQGKTQEAMEAFRAAHRLTSDPGLLAACGDVLVGYEQYGVAREFLEPALAKNPSLIGLRLNLAIAVFHSASPVDALKVLDETPTDQRNGDYFLLRAQILDALGRLEEATEDLNRGFRAAPTRSDLYFQAALFLIKHEQYGKAVAVLQQASRVVPDASEILLTEAIAYELLQRPEEAQKILSEIESRWPEWGEPYIVNGIMLETRLKSAQAKPLLETAISLGEHDSKAYYYLALATTHADPDDVDRARQAIDQALKLNPNDPYVRALAGRIAYARRDYNASVEQLTAALHLWPDMIEAHQALSATYRAMGDREKAASELKEVLRINQATRGADQSPPSPVRNLLFSVRPPVNAPVVGNP